MKLLASVCLLLLALFAQSQNNKPPFAAEIEAFRQKDSLQPPTARPILFVGSSSIRLWSSLQEDFEGKNVLNRGFGGATIPDVVRYAEETIYRYQPSQIIFYCGENDLASSDSVSAQEVVQRFTSLYKDIRKRLPDVKFTFISIKPSPSRAHLKPKIVAANNYIRKYLRRQSKAEFVDVYKPMLNNTGRPRPELFGADSLHMNALGYELWKQKIAPHLK